MVKFVIVAVFTLAAVAIGSLLWPKFTGTPRPKELQQVHDAVIKTQAGQDVADIMGVETTTEGGIVEPLNLSTMVASVGTSIVSGVEKKVGEAVAGQAAAVLLNQIKQLPTPAQEDIKQAICKP